MRSLLIEFHRFGAQRTGLLREGDPYLVAAAGHPVRPVSMTIDDAPFRALMQSLRYKGERADRLKALQQLGALVADLLGTQDLSDLSDEKFPIQLDLVVNATELGALPFEAAVDKDGEPLFVSRERPVVLTRRVRQDIAEVGVSWPPTPRILFVWACPRGAGVEVPDDEHESALREALEPWIPAGGPALATPDPSGVLTVLKEASLDSIRLACEGAKETPFSHVHFLAHGCTVGRGFDQRFGIALHHPISGELKAATPEELVDALAPLAGQPVILTLATCDAANDTNTIIPERSIAHTLHVLGIPVVVASQFPFTVRGSTLFVQRFYGALLEGEDVRDALHLARLALYENRDIFGHDWASLLGYARLPEGYAEHLQYVRLRSVLSCLWTLQTWADELLDSDACDPGQFDRLARLLKSRIKVLEARLPDTELSPRKGVLEEHLGLLGSAEKRLAELYFELGKSSKSEDWQQRMRNSLESARSWYRKGFDCNLSHHWDGVQFLSLEAALVGKIYEPGYWHAAVTAAEIHRKNPNEHWACGSLAELYLLASSAGLPDGTARAVEFLEEMKTRVANGGSDRIPLESTERQFRRYTGWWTTSNGFFPGCPDLSAEGKLLVEVLTR